MEPVLNLVRHNRSSRRFIQEGYVMLLVSQETELREEDLQQIDGFILDTDVPTEAYDIVKRLRTHPSLKVALRPIFTSASYRLPAHVTIHTEGMIELSAMSSYIQRIATIHKRIDTIHEPRLVPNDILIEHRLLSYLYSRDTQLNPSHSRESHIGYEFPLLSLFCKKTEAISLLKILQNVTEKNHLSFKLHDHIHLCKSCSGNYLNFRECCPKCKSIDIEAHDMIHHFVCAHVAPEKDFKVEDGLECPKCDKGLRHIGIDYDKPSTIYSCNSCSHEFQNPDMLSLCMDCGTENQLEELMQKSIGNYTITQKGEQLLFQKEYRFSPKETRSPESIDVIKLPLFKLLLDQEIKRIKISKGSSYFATIKFENSELELLNTQIKNGLKKEIYGIVKSYLRDTDILSTESFNRYYLLLPETSSKDLERLENIDYNLTKLLSDSTKENQGIAITIHKIKGEDLMQSYFL